MRVLITGGLGFLGRHVTALLESENIPYAVFDNLDPLCGGTPSEFLPRYTFKRDLLEDGELDYVIRQYLPTHIFHLAAYGRNLTCARHVQRAIRVNIEGTARVLDAAYEYDLRAIVCSSNIVLSPENTVYRFTKQACEALVELYAKAGTSAMALRPANIYGAGQSRTEFQPCAFAGLDLTFEKEGLFRISGDGTQTRDWVHVDDVAQSFLLAGRSDLSGQTLDIATGIQTSMNRVAELLHVYVKYTVPRPGDAQALISDPQPALKLLGFKAIRSLEKHIWEAFPTVTGNIKGLVDAHKTDNSSL